MFIFSMYIADACKIFWALISNNLFFYSITVYAIYFASLIFRESGLQDIFASG